METQFVFCKVCLPRHFNPWRCDHCVVSKREEPITQWCGTTTLKKCYLTNSAAKA